MLITRRQLMNLTVPGGAHSILISATSLVSGPICGPPVWCDVMWVIVNCVSLSLGALSRILGQPDMPGVLRLQRRHQPSLVLGERGEVHRGHGPESYTREWYQVRLLRRRKLAHLYHIIIIIIIWHLAATCQEPSNNALLCWGLNQRSLDN